MAFLAGTLLALGALTNARPALSSGELSIRHHHHHYRTSPSPRLLGSPSLLAANQLLDGAGWPQLQGILDKLPVFTIANSEGKPLQYQVNERTMAIFYADVEAAKTELAAAQKFAGNAGSDLVAVGLGNAFKLASEGQAMVVPGKSELMAAGAPEDAQPMGQEVPLFFCTELRTEESGLPLFMSHSDCAAAVGAAWRSMEISPLALQGVVEQLAAVSDPETCGFSFVPPTASLKHIQQYLGNGIYMREVKEGE
jgi:hypothetical protein